MKPIHKLITNRELIAQLHGMSEDAIICIYGIDGLSRPMTTHELNRLQPELVGPHDDEFDKLPINSEVIRL